MFDSYAKDLHNILVLADRLSASQGASRQAFRGLTTGRANLAKARDAKLPGLKINRLMPAGPPVDSFMLSTVLRRPLCVSSTVKAAYDSSSLPFF